MHNEYWLFDQIPPNTNAYNFSVTDILLWIKQVYHLLLSAVFFLLYYAPRKISGEHIVAALSVRQSVSPSVRPIRVRPITLLFEVGFQNYFTEMTTMLRRRVARNIWVATLKVKVTA